MSNKKQNIDHDRLFKELLSTFFWEFLELFLPQVAEYVERNSIVFLSQEIFVDVTAGDRREVDLVARMRFRGQDSFFLVHTETQSYSQTRFKRRMFHYFARLDQIYNLPIYPVAVFSFDAPMRPEPSSYQVEFPDFKVLDFNFATIQLNRLNWRDFVKQRNPVAAALMAKMKIAPEDRVKVKLECLRLLARLQMDPARNDLISGFVDTYLRLNKTEEAAFKAELNKIGSDEKEEIMQIVTSWMEQGIEQGIERGIERGIEQGIEQGMEILLWSQLNRRLGGVEPNLEEQIRALSVEQLQELGQALLDFGGQEDLLNWLSSQSQRKS